MNRLPLVSCLMPTYNRAWKKPELIGEAVYWFLQQDYAGPRELLILCDAPGAELRLADVPGKGDYRVWVNNWHARFPSLAAKYDFLVSSTQAEILLPWEDDDIGLPGRITDAVNRLKDGTEYYNPKGAFFQNGAGQLTLCSPHSVHHNASAFRKSAVVRTGGYVSGAGMDNRQDAYMDWALRRQARTKDGWVKPQEIHYIYRWCHAPGVLHLSSHQCPDTGYRREDAPAGVVEVTPQMGRDYAAEARAYTGAHG